MQMLAPLLPWMADQWGVFLVVWLVLMHFSLTLRTFAARTGEVFEMYEDVHVKNWPLFIIACLFGLLLAVSTYLRFVGA